MFDLKSYVDERCRLIEAALDAQMPSENTPPAVLHKAMRYSVFSGGKRLRPILCLVAAEAVKDPSGNASRDLQNVMLPALAVELLHTYTLIHDDLPCMDNDCLRRGKPASHVVFGEANALLAGDALQALAFDMVARAPVPSRYPSNQLVLELAEAAGSRGVVGGQVEDLAACNSEQSADIVGFIHLHKTASLFRSAVRMGGISGNALEEDLGELTEYGVNLGLAFQIADDLLDAECGTKKSDKASCLSVYEPDTARRRAETLVAQAVSAAERLRNTGPEPLVGLTRFAFDREF